MDSGALITAQDEDVYRMVNVHPKRTGLPFTVYISEKQGRHDVRVKVAAGPKASEFVASVAVRPEVEVVGGSLAAKDFALVRQWIELNRDVIVAFWNRDIEDSVDAVMALKPLPKA
jgi:Domain of unknown function (DUF4160)